MIHELDLLIHDGQDKCAQHDEEEDEGEEENEPRQVDISRTAYLVEDPCP